jgi:hypothetical protein
MQKRHYLSYLMLKCTHAVRLVFSVVTDSGIVTASNVSKTVHFHTFNKF